MQFVISDESVQAWYTTTFKEMLAICLICIATVHIPMAF